MTLRGLTSDAMLSKRNQMNDEFTKTVYYIIYRSGVLYLAED